MKMKKVMINILLAMMIMTTSVRSSPSTIPLINMQSPLFLTILLTKFLLLFETGEDDVLGDDDDNDDVDDKDLCKFKPADYSLDKLAIAIVFNQIVDTGDDVLGNDNDNDDAHLC